jgi:hypothetical protein
MSPPTLMVGRRTATRLRSSTTSDPATVRSGGSAETRVPVSRKPGERLAAGDRQRPVDVRRAREGDQGVAVLQQDRLADLQVVGQRWAAINVTRERETARQAGRGRTGCLRTLRGGALPMSYGPSGRRRLTSPASHLPVARTRLKSHSLSRRSPASLCEPNRRARTTIYICVQPRVRW